MADSDLEGIPGLLPKHSIVLADRCHITTARALVQSDRRFIYAAMGRLRPRPALEEISRWQDAARDLDANTEPDPGWDQVAAFVVSFEHRTSEGARQRRVAVEQAERSAPTPRAVWPGWGCVAVCSWMHEHLDEPVTDRESAPPAGPSAAAVAPSDPPADGPKSDGGDGPDGVRIAFDQVTLIDPNGTATDVHTSGPDTVTLERAAGSRLRVAVSGPSADTDIEVAVRVRRPGRASWTPHQPARTLPGRPVELDLSEVPAGEHTAVLAAWTTGGSARPRVVALPTLSVASSGG